MDNPATQEEIFDRFMWYVSETIKFQDKFGKSRKPIQKLLAEEQWNKMEEEYRALAKLTMERKI